MYLVHKGRIMHRHQTEGLCQSWVRSRFANHVVMEYSPIKCLVLRPNGRKKLVGAKYSHAIPATRIVAYGNAR